MAFDVRELVNKLFPNQTQRPSSLEARQGPREVGRATHAKPGVVSHLPGLLPIPHNSQAEWLAMWSRAPEVTLLPKPCGWCGKSVFWLSVYGAYRCNRCHPPAFKNMVRMWVRVVPTEDGPQVVRLGDTPSIE